jgi:hypothetical protein
LVIPVFSFSFIDLEDNDNIIMVGSVASIAGDEWMMTFSSSFEIRVGGQTRIQKSTTTSSSRGSIFF